MTGGLTEAGPILLEPVTAAFRAHLTAHARCPEIPVLISSVGQDAGLVGAADLVRQTD